MAMFDSNVNTKSSGLPMRFVSNCDCQLMSARSPEGEEEQVQLRTSCSEIADAAAAVVAVD